MKKSTLLEYLINSARIALYFLMVCVLLGGLFSFLSTRIHHFAGPYISEPTCQRYGYEYEVCSFCGEVHILNRTPKADHSFSKWTVEQEPSLLYGGKMTSVCDTCSEHIAQSLPPISKLPRMYITSTGDTASVLQSGSFIYQYYHDETETTGFVRIQYLPLYGDGFVNRHDYVFSPVSGDMADDSQFYLYTDHFDYLHTRALTAYELWRQIAEENAYTEYQKLFAAQDGTSCFGEPVLFYQNGAFSEIRTLLKPYGDFAENAGTVTFAVSCENGQVNSQYGGVSARNEFELFYSAFVNEDNNERAHQLLEESTDLAVLLDYYVFCDELLAVDSLTERLIWASADGLRWAPVPLYPEQSLGVLSGNKKGLAPSDSSVLADDGSLMTTFWKKVRTVCASEIRERRAALTGSVLVPDNVRRILSENSVLISSEILAAARDYARLISITQKYPSDAVASWYEERCRSLR